MYNYVEIMKVLINNGANIDAKKDTSNRTPLFFASAYDCLDAIKELLDREAYYYAIDFKGKTFLNNLSPECRKEIKEYMCP